MMPSKNASRSTLSRACEGVSRVVDEGFSPGGTPSITGLGAIAVLGGMASAENDAHIATSCSAPRGRNIAPPGFYNFGTKSRGYSKDSQQETSGLVVPRLFRSLGAANR